MAKEGEAEVRQAMERQSKMRGDIILLPQPSDDSEDPLVSLRLPFSAWILATQCEVCSADRALSRTGASARST